MFGSHSVLHSQESSGNSGSRKGVTHPSIVVIHEIKKPTEKEVSELLCYKSITQTNKKKNRVLLWEVGFCNKKKECSRRLWFLWKQLILVPKQNSVGKCQVATHQCEVRRSGFPLFFPLKLNTIPKELLSHKHLQPEKIKPCNGSTAIQLDRPHWIVCNKWWVTNTGIHNGELNVQSL